MEINGLPLHSLITHAAVVFGPLAGLFGLGYAIPRFRDWLRWPLVVTATVAAVSVWVAYYSGEALEDANTYGGELAGLLETHESRAKILRIAVTGLAVFSFLAAWWHTRTGPLRIALTVLVAAAGVLTLVYCVLTGEAGARIGWYGVNA